MRREIKDSVFTCLFGQPEYALELYRALHPEDTSVTVADCEIVTLENVVTVNQYNDFGLLVRNMLIVLLEAQSTFSPNVVLRVFLYLAETYKRYVETHQLNLYGSAPVKIPRPELYVVYTGAKADIPEELRLSSLYDGDGSVDLEVKVLRDSGTGDILDQYVRFCAISDECREKHGRTEETIREIFRRCREQGILVPFLATCEKEVSDIMATLFNYEKILEMHDYDIAKKAEERGFSKGISQGISQGSDMAFLSGLKSIMGKLGYTVEQAMDALSIPEETRDRLQAYFQS